MNPLLFFAPFVFFCSTDLLALEQSKTFYKPDWFDIVEAEVKCCKEAVCVIDMSSFTKFEITVSIYKPKQKIGKLVIFICYSKTNSVRTLVYCSVSSILSHFYDSLAPSLSFLICLE